MSEPTAAQWAEIASRELDRQIDEHEEERWQRRHAARWPTALEYDIHLDGLPVIKGRDHA
jgi:hypothetical protein